METIVFVGCILVWIYSIIDFCWNRSRLYIPDKFIRILRVKDDSFLRKTFLLKNYEKDTSVTGQKRGARFLLYPDVIFCFVSTICLIITIILFILLKTTSLIPDLWFVFSCFMYYAILLLYKLMYVFIDMFFYV